MIRNFALIWILLVVFQCDQPDEIDANNQVARSETFQPLNTTPSPQGSEIALGLAGLTKVLCSAVYVSNREIEEAFPHANTLFLPEIPKRAFNINIDQSKQSLSISLSDTLVKTASYHGAYGCILDIPEGLQFTPTPIEPDLKSDTSTNGYSDERQAPLSEKQLQAINTAKELAFQDSSFTMAFLVVHQGKLAGAFYGPGVSDTTQLESWSMGKSLTATLIGRIIQLGHLTLDQQAPIEEWQRPGDPRGKIRIKDLLQMSSGLRFIAHRDPTAEQYQQYLDHFYIYTGAVDAFSYSVTRPLQFPVGQEGRYRNCDPLALGYVIRNILTEKGINYHTFPQKELFDYLGIRKQVMETDPYGNFLLTGFDYGTPKNWAKLGQLYLQDGTWETQQILPRGFAKFVSTPAPGWEEPIYGGLFWINGTSEMPIPKNSYYMAGAGGQRTIIIPDKELVVVRMGHFKGNIRGMQTLNEALATLMEAF